MPVYICMYRQRTAKVQSVYIRLIYERREMPDNTRGNLHTGAGGDGGGTAALQKINK